MEERLLKLRHSLSHVMAQAVLGKFPDAMLAIGPAIEEGFYYDFLLPRALTPEDLQDIEQEMRKIIKGRHSFIRRELSREEARKLFRNQRFKLELIDELPEGEPITTYTHDTFTDLCRGPHVDNTKDIPINAFKLLEVSGAYWRGDERNPQLQRIYGTAFFTKEELDAYLTRLEEIKERDHRKLGKELELFHLSDEIGSGLVLWLPKGAAVRSALEEYWRSAHFKAGYSVVYSPHIARLDLWKTSGHWDFYRDNMYSPMEIDGQDYELKPMNCPFHIQMYKMRNRSYRELPLRWAELGTVYRYERGGVLHGLMRVRGFTQDDAHIFVTPEQLNQEIINILNLNLEILRTCGFSEYDVFLSTMPQKHVGSDENWQKATDALKAALEKMGLTYKIDPGEGVFYGPKIDIKIKDALGRSWQCTTVQVDFNLPERFHVTYVGGDGLEHQPIMIHRALMGSLERFFGVLIEHYKGAFPVWMAPVQVRLIPVTDKQVDYCRRVVVQLRDVGIRAELDDGPDRMQKKIRTAQQEKVPYQVVVGQREAELGQVAVRLRTNEDLGPMPLSEFKSMLLRIIDGHSQALK
ncbi:MAG: threonine--tRNA ligase [Candidatus Thorarchaeota archaeon]|nr:MAG: threonine--tRNA ligase [Candidatus Thorarchaeota archaeon]